MTLQEIIESIDYCLKCDNDRIPTTQEDLQTIKEALEMKQSQNINGISYCNTYNSPNMFCSYGKKIRDHIKQAINEQPIVDTERHAHWIKEKVEDITYPWYRRYCSNCKMHSPLGLEHNYCPHCGCKMDEDRNESRNT